MSQPSKTPSTPPASPITPASTKKNCFTSLSAAPSAFSTPISRRRSRIAMTRVLTMPSVATASAEAAENSQQQIENGKKDAQAFGGVEQRKRAETEILDFLFRGIDQRRRFHAHAQTGVGRFVRRGGTAQHVTQIVDLRGAQCFSDRERNQQAAAAESAESRSRFGFHNADDVQMFFFWNDRETAGILRGAGGFGGQRLPFGVAQHQIFAD